MQQGCQVHGQLPDGRFRLVIQTELLRLLLEEVLHVAARATLAEGAFGERRAGCGDEWNCDQDGCDCSTETHVSLLTLYGYLRNLS